MLQRSERALRYLLLVVIAFICGCPSAVQAQVIHGSIYGQVTDTTGAAVPNATITVTDQGKGTSVQVTSNESGGYTRPKSDSRRCTTSRRPQPGFGTCRQTTGVQVCSRHLTEGRPASSASATPAKRVTVTERASHSFKPTKRKLGSCF